MDQIILVFTILAVIVILVLLAIVMSVALLWVRAYASQAPVRIWRDLIGMKLRRVPPHQVVLTYISAIKAGLEVDIGMLEAHYLAGGSMQSVVRAMIAADKANIELQFQQAAAIDLAGRNIVDAVQTSVNPKVIDCPDPAKTATGMLDAVAKDGIRLLIKARKPSSSPSPRCPPRTSPAAAPARRRRRPTRPLLPRGHQRC